MDNGSVIHKDRATRARSNLDNYVWTRHDFTWARARAWLSGLPDGQGLNIGYEAVDRHARSSRRDSVALVILGPGSTSSEVTYGELAEATSRFANLLGESGVRRGERVFVLLDGGWEAYVAGLAVLRYGAVLTTLPAGRAAEAPRCLAASEPALLLTTEDLYDRTIAPVRRHLAGLREVLLTGERLDAALEKMPADFTVPPTDPQWPAMVHFTAGTSAATAGVVHAHESVVAQLASATYALDLHDDDTLQVSVAAGRLTHTAYGIIAPLVRGIRTVIDTTPGPLLLPRDARVSVWYAPAEALNRLCAERSPHPPPKSVRLVVAEGGGLRPDAVVRSRSSIGQTVHDTWWQTETGAILISNYAGLDVRPGSMGLPLPGVTAAVVRRTGPGQVVPIGAPDIEGELAVRAGWPSMFQRYLAEPGRVGDCFADGWYLTGDLVSRDADGYFWFAGRAPARS
ncbi:AMP-binding protein [Actinoplanes solisilvae]|uniref:AMP-binding protein n=1 Tax=Actinoplanes solisilvae TaxID=2486853 RepID=UPI0013E2AB67|nr:AMP-binding protein [Actinoplanes solisilvae]